jgi:HPt (histidine-containing phosphotransfer) domain-containing protein
MREVFIEKGFTGYISKPIEITELDSIIAQWIPPEKRVTMKKPPERRPAESTELTIEGIDIAKGIAMTGGTEAGYRKVLSMFRKDAKERIVLFKAFLANGGSAGGNNFSAEDLAALATQAHALKSAAGTIGAAEVSAEAAELEAAGKAGDMAAIRERLGVFCKHLAELIEGIGKVWTEPVLENKREDPDEGLQDRDRAQEAVAALAVALRAALEAKNMKEIDKLIEEIEQLPLDTGTQEAIHAVSDKVLLGEYGGAAETIATLLAAKES